ncbi:MAG: hypothetical protein ACK58T_20180, partial [Phycisphaerae bacterium]
DITINAGANFTISGSNRLFVYRNFNNNGTFTANTSTIQFVGCSNAGTLSCSGTQTLYEGDGNMITVPAGWFTVFFPEDATEPGLAPMEVTILCDF